jgi:hypothetical protein
MLKTKQHLVGFQLSTMINLSFVSIKRHSDPTCDKTQTELWRKSVQIIKRHENKEF